jgi:hypothetical protein
MKYVEPILFTDTLGLIDGESKAQLEHENRQNGYSRYIILP